jgi:hypothetical protein
MPFTETCSAAECRQRHRRGHLQPVQPLAGSVYGATNWIPAPRVSESRDRPQPSARAARAFAICLLLSCVADTSVARERRADATTRAGSHGRRPDRIRGSQWLAPPVRASRRLTRYLAYVGVASPGARANMSTLQASVYRKPDQPDPSNRVSSSPPKRVPADLEPHDRVWRRT